MSSNTASANGNGAMKLESNIDNKIFNVIAAAHNNDNVIISPLLLEALLTLLYLGSDGVTAAELERTLQLKRFGNNAKMANHFAAQLQLGTDAAADTRLQLCSQLLLSEQHESGDEFKKIAQKYFHTTVVQHDLHSAPKIRVHLDTALAQAAAGYAWRMSDALLSSTVTSEAATAILVAAVHFQSKWFLPFSAYRTGIYDFQLSTNGVSTSNGQLHSTPALTAVPVPMLFDDDMFVKFAEFHELDARAIELPYEHDDELAMLVVLPNRVDGLVALEQQLQSVDLNKLAERMQMESVQLLLPKFKIDFECGMRQCLEQLGITTIFSTRANFKNLLHENATNSLMIADILHKVCIEVNESGSEGANNVVYKPIVISNSIDSRKKFFRADHPFYFAIRSRDATYFMGHVTKF